MTTNHSSIPVDQAIELLINSYNKEVSDFDQLTEELSNERAENAQLKALIKEYEKNTATVLVNAENAEQMLAQAKTERDQAVNKVKDLNIQLKAFKEIAATPKKVREKIKGYQDRLTSQKAATEQNKRNLNQERGVTKALREEIAELNNRLDSLGINQVYRNDEDIIQTYPYHLGGMVEGHDSQTVPLLYLHQSGRGGLILLNDEDEAELVEAPAEDIKPNEQTLAHCGQWLRRVKANNWEVEGADLASLSQDSL